MTPRKATAKVPPPPDPAIDLAPLGLKPGESIRWRRRETDRWRDGTVTRLERDGSLGLTDTKGAARAIPLDQIQVQLRGPRGAKTWEPLRERAARSEQLQLE
ncbi:MAG: hypothetical protein QOG03_251 [Actinomycetota bacterium]|jgi:hypothetical protein|nr:hypothetical protein [Actinomycetota bacterium]